jgi:NAD(P)-dependent dehydrogenase (short-subunit alcohol dehydrogenase family)
VNSQWNHKTAVVTGAGSGIGRALALAMSRRGARVMVTDINEDSARTVAAECGPAARARHMDVREAPAVQAVVDETVRDYGGIDFLFNNAGLGLGGETDEIPLSAWDTLIDVNIRGVVHGVKAAYPHMLRQRFGHIVNTASMAGLGGVPLLAPYSMTKHAVVGLSTSLRHEAGARGVRVSVLCPGGIETPILDSTTFDGQKYEGWLPNVRRYLERLGGPLYPADKLAEETLAAVERNVGIIVIPARARTIWRVARFFPGLADKPYAAAVAAERAERISSQTADN